MFDRDRAFRGYRGFGVCRDIARINELARARRARPHRLHAAAARARCGGRRCAGDAKYRRGRDARRQRAAATRTAERAEQVVESAPWSERPAPAVAPAAANVVPFRAAPAPEAKAPSLSAVERNAFRELAQELTARLRGAQEQAAVAAEEQHAAAETSAAAEIAPAAAQIAADIPPIAPALAADAQSAAAPQQPPVADHSLLDRVPAGVLVYRNDSLLYANRHFLEWSGYDSV